MNPHVTPVAQPYRRVPIHLEDKVEEKLNEMLKQKIIEEVNEPCRWVSPMVIVPKANGDIRICIDMRQANKAIVRQNHPLPTLDDMWAQLAGSTVFSKLDVKNAFHQIELAEESRYITTFIAKRGLMRYRRLMFGINNAPELFQKTLSQIVTGCEGSLNFLDDLLVHGKGYREHDKRLNKLMKRLKDYNVVLNKDKAEIGVSAVKFVGHIISKDGVRPCEDKVEAIKKFRMPESPEETRSFLGLVTYLGRFIPNLGTLSEPLRTLMKKSEKFKWKDEHGKCFQDIKNCIVNESQLGFFDRQDKTFVITDASPYGLGAILIQKNGNDEERVIMYASKSLSEVERRYCQTEREGLAVVWAIERFHQYLFGAKFTLITDHKALTFLFKPSSKPSARIERWVLRLQGYDFSVVYKEGKGNLADPLSRLSAVDKNPEPFDEESEDYVNAILNSSVPEAVSIEEIVESSKQDEIYKDLKEGISKGIWSTKVKDMKHLAGEFCLAGDLILRSRRLYIPSVLRVRILDAGHEGHPGRNKLMSRLREKVWWPEITQDVDRKTKSCLSCSLVSAPNKTVPLKMRQLPSAPWVDLAMDFTCTSEYKKELLVIIDYYSRYIDIKIQTSTTAEETINSLKHCFSTLGYPETITCDNGPPFDSGDFKGFCRSNNIRIYHTVPGWAQANGLVERQNRGIKKRLQISALTKSKTWKDDLLIDYLTMYRTTAQETTGKTPFELMFGGRKMKDKIPALTSWTSAMDEEVRDRDTIRKGQMKERADDSRGAKESNIEVGDKVFLRNAPTNKLTTNFGPEIYTVLSAKGGDYTIKSDESNVVRRRHVTTLKKISNPLLSEVTLTNQREEEKGKNTKQKEEKPDDAEDCKGSRKIGKKLI